MSTNKSLTQASLSAFKWDYFGSTARLLSSMAVTVLLARLLGPEPFGLVAIAWLVIGLGNLVADLGMGPALVQRPDVSEEDVRSAFTIQGIIGLGLTALLAFSSPLLGSIFREPKVIPVILALSPIFILQGLGVPATSVLKRNLDFKRIQLAQVGSYVIGYLLVGIPLAALGFAVWSLVIAQLLQAGLFSLFCYTQVRHSVMPRLALPENGLIGFGAKVLGTNLVNWAITSLPSIFIGRLFDIIALGLYNRAYVLVTMPMNSLITATQQVTFSAYSRRQNDPETVRRAYLAGVGFMALIMLPIYGCVALVPTTVIHGLFGTNWSMAIPLLTPLALAAPVHAIMAIGGPMLWSQNQVGSEFRAQLSTAAVSAVVLSGAAQMSLVTVAWAVLAISILRFVLIAHAALKILSLSWRSLLDSIRGGVILLIPTGAVVLFSDWVFSTFHLSSSFRFGFDIIVGFIFLSGIICAAGKRLFTAEMLWFWNLVCDHFSGSVALMMQRIVPARKFAMDE